MFCIRTNTPLFASKTLYLKISKTQNKFFMNEVCLKYCVYMYIIYVSMNQGKCNVLLKIIRRSVHSVVNAQYIYIYFVC